MKGRNIPYSAEELIWLEANRTLPISDYHAQFGRSDVSAGNLHGLRKRKGWRTGRTGQFQRGMNTWNKGMSYMPKGCEKGWFRKGQEPHNTRHLGYERISVDGYVEVSIDQVNPHTGYKRRFALKHRVLWEQANGPIPDGHALKCLDGDKTNTDPSNWELIPRSLLPRLNGGKHKRRVAYDDAAPELKPALMAVAKLEQAVMDARKA